MPEGDTIHKLQRAFGPLLTGKRVERLRLRDRGEIDAVRGETITEVRAAGKHLLLIFSGGLGLRVHLGLQGRWRRFAPGASLPTWSRFAPVHLSTADAQLLCVRAREVELSHGVAKGDSPALVGLGPDLLADRIDLDIVVARAREPHRADAPIGEALIDQGIAAGIGNVYKSEILFLRGVDPWATLGSLDDNTVGCLYSLARELLVKNVAPAGPGRHFGRVTVSRPQYRSASERQEPRLWVYGRARQPCLKCRTPIEMKRQGDDARSTYFCRTCQKMPAAD